MITISALSASLIIRHLVRPCRTVLCCYSKCKLKIFSYPTETGRKAEASIENEWSPCPVPDKEHHEPPPGTHTSEQLGERSKNTNTVFQSWSTDSPEASRRVHPCLQSWIRATICRVQNLDPWIYFYMATTWRVLIPCQCSLLQVSWVRCAWCTM